LWFHHNTEEYVCQLKFNDKRKIIYEKEIKQLLNPVRLIFLGFDGKVGMKEGLQ